MPPALHTEICNLLGIQYPIIQTGMGWVAKPELVAAVSNAGAIGFLAAATIPPSEVEGEIEAIKALTDKPFGVNFLMDAPGADIISDAIIRQGVRAAGYNRAPNAELIGRLKDGGVICIPTCGAVKHAVKAENLGADIIIVQGSEGGGHTGVVPTSLLAPRASDAVNVPVVAAGGYFDGRGLVSALAYGTAGIAMGTRFLMTAESPVPDATQTRYIDADVSDVFITSGLDGLPQRVVGNELVRRLESGGVLGQLFFALRNALAYRSLTGASISDLLSSALSMRKNERLSRSQTLMAVNAPMLARTAMEEGDPIHGYLPSGSVAGVIEDLPTCAELIQQIMREAEETVKRLAN
ncbi:MAG: 2-nitropropane dioxygenase [Deltaproteobacteria bacterium]|nr:2-nitropropane dioxygenase [Deltaproteobacteria bacterium]